VCSNLQCTYFAYITDLDVRFVQIQIYCYKGITHTAYIYTVATLWHTLSTVAVPGCSGESKLSMRYSCRAQGHDTIHTYISRFRLGNYTTVIREMHIKLLSKQVDADEGCSGGFYFPFILVKIVRTTLSDWRGEGNTQFLLTHDVLHTFYASLVQILLLYVLALWRSSQVCYLCNDILNRSCYLTSDNER
jgi:hypothetical protein